MRRKPDDDTATVPFPTAPVSNGEWVPGAITEKQRLAHKLIAEECEAQARRHGMTRAQFLRTAAATATAMMVLNRIHGLDQWGDAAAMPVRREHCEDLDAARELLDRKGLFIMDVQTHHIDTDNALAQNNCRTLRFNFAIRGFRERGYELPPDSLVACPDLLGKVNFTKEVFVDSETDVAILSGLPYNGLVIGPRLMAETRDFVNELAGSPRALSQAMIEPASPPGTLTSLDTFEQQVREFGASALKCYTYNDGQGRGWRLDDEQLSYPMLAEARRLGITLVNTHKGLPSFATNAEESVRTTDFPKVVRDWPDINFCAYHSGYYSQNNHPEGKQGISEFIEVINSMTKKERKRVYAELGSTFAFALLQGTRNEGVREAAHILGQLLKALGPKNILWGTDSIWYGSPQFLIDIFKNFQIPADMQEQFGYPPLTMKAKKRILGLNAARLYGVNPKKRRCTVPADRLSQVQLALGGPRANRSLRWYGPQTRRGFFTQFARELRANA